MENVIQFKPRETPHATGEAFCVACNHTWEAVAPVGETQLECPQCRTMRGLWKFPFAPSDGTLVRECVCGCQLFYITPEWHMCARCGTQQEYE